MGQIIPAGAPYRASVPTQAGTPRARAEARGVGLDRAGRRRRGLNEHHARGSLTEAARRDGVDGTGAVTIFSHPTRIAEAVDELWGGALRYEEEL